MIINEDTIIAIIRGVQPEGVSDIVKALVEEGICWIEVSLSEEEMGLACLRRLTQEYVGDLHLGAGTVTSPVQVDQALDAGAQYIITPGWDRELVRYAQKREICIFPGVYSPGEIMQARNEGIDIVKLFPAGCLGTDYIRNLFGPFPTLRLMAVGGINQHNIRDYFKAGCTSFAIGSDLVPRGASRQQLDSIRKKARQYRELADALQK